MCFKTRQVANGTIVACTNEEYWKKYLEKGDRFGYELIMKGTPCHLYVDLDINKEQYNIHVTGRMVYHGKMD